MVLEIIQEIQERCDTRLYILFVKFYVSNFMMWRREEAVGGKY
jgi:hypothetical protein